MGPKSVHPQCGDTVQNTLWWTIFSFEDYGSHIIHVMGDTSLDDEASMTFMHCINVKKSSVCIHLIDEKSTKKPSLHNVMRMHYSKQLDHD